MWLDINFILVILRKFSDYFNNKKKDDAYEYNKSIDIKQYELISTLYCSIDDLYILVLIFTYANIYCLLAWYIGVLSFI